VNLLGASAQRIDAGDAPRSGPPADRTAPTPLASTADGGAAARPAGSAPAVEVHDLTVAYDVKPVLWDVDFSLPQGKLIAVVGPNGAGKSTLLKAILGMVPTISGWAQVLGRPPAEQRRNIAYVPQRESVDWDFPTDVLDVVMMGLYAELGWFRRPGRRQREQAMEALRRVGMADYHDRQIGRLSGGQQQRVFLARALVQNAPVYFMDEPFAGVDAVTERAIAGLLREQQTEGRTVLCVHHDLQTVPEYFDWVVMLNLRLVAVGPIAAAFTAEHLHAAYGGRMQVLSQAAEAALRPK
jgi:manganese/zinc/iron transport system ATP- binding protein